MKIKVANFLIFQIGWLCTVLLGAGSYHWAAPMLILAIVILHLRMSHKPTNELRLIMFAVLLGTVWESLLTAQGVVEYANGQRYHYLAPVWIIAMWALLATSLNLSLRWLHDRYILAMVFGAIGGPLAFLAGERLNAVTFPDTFSAMTWLAIGWGVMMISLIVMAKRFDGFSIPEKL